MSNIISVADEDYKKFQAALVLTGEDEETALTKLIRDYAHSAFARVLSKDTATETVTASAVADITEDAQKRAFVNWFRGLTRNGKPYNPVTISGYTGRIENACSDSAFHSVAVNNLFSITELSSFLVIQEQIKSCPGYVAFDARSHSGFTAALRKYEEFLRFQESGSSSYPSAPSTCSYTQLTNVHRWTIEEDEICCRSFIECYVLNRSNVSSVQFLEILAKEVPEVSEGSLRMKIQNVKYLSVQAELEDTSNFKCLSQYSMQCERAFRKALQEFGM